MFKFKWTEKLVWVFFIEKLLNTDILVLGIRFYIRKVRYSEMYTISISVSFFIKFKLILDVSNWSWKFKYEIIIDLTYYITKYLFEKKNVLSLANHNKPDTFLVLYIWIEIETNAIYLLQIELKYCPSCPSSSCCSTHICFFQVHLI